METTAVQFQHMKQKITLNFDISYFTLTHNGNQPSQEERNVSHIINKIK